MSRVIYSLKIWMFKSQFKLTHREEKSLAAICYFAVRIYVKAWYTAPVPTHAPRQDLELLKNLSLYKQRDAIKATHAMRKILHHLWYLSEELVALSFFDTKLTAETKNKMRLALKKPGEINPSKRPNMDFETIENKELEDFVTSNTNRFFEITGLPCIYFS